MRGMEKIIMSNFPARSTQIQHKSDFVQFAIYKKKPRNHYRFSFENQQEISMDDRGTLYTQKGGYTMTGDFSGVLDLLNGWF